MTRDVKVEHVRVVQPQPQEGRGYFHLRTILYDRRREREWEYNHHILRQINYSHISVHRRRTDAGGRAVGVCPYRRVYSTLAAMKWFISFLLDFHGR